MSIAFATPCSHCQNTAQQIIVGSQPIRLAIAHFVQLQTAGHQARMCKAADGGYTVCYPRTSEPLQS